MAGNRIEYDIAVLDKGGTIKSRTNAAKELNKELERTQKLASGTKSGDQAMRRAGYGEYTTAGGVTGRGGASARDFAAEAQGLGGLVRLYATYAANVFAVSAAFTALREAMNTEIMIRGLDQLGAASGIAMGGLAKQFAAASGGAISLRESMEATAKAISSGLTAQQFMQLGEVAKGASQALGVNMSDAVSRLTRGITKLEPELLDELGIFTKTGKAAEDYARSVGKAESQLTDFERRQAFANAVLKEGTDKFGEIAQAGNPYDQLLASLKNVAQDILTVVNTVVGPIAKFLAENTGLITAGIGLMALKITQMAIPTLNRYSDVLKASAAQAGKFAAVQSERAWASQAERAKEQLGITASEQRMVGLTAERVVLTEQLEKLKKQKTTIQDIVSLENKLAGIQAKISAEKRFQAKQDEELQSRLLKPPSVLGGDIHAMMMASASRGADRRYIGKTILSDVVEKTADAGTIAGFKELGKQLGEYSGRLGTAGKITTGFTGSLAILGQTFLNLTSFVSRFFPILAVLTTIMEVAELLFSKNAKAVKEFESAIDSLAESTKTATAVAEKYKDTLTVDSINAYANSIEGLADNLEKVNMAFAKADRASSWFDKAKDFLAVFIGGQRSAVLADNLADTITNSLKVMPVGAIRDQMAQSIGDILGTTDLSEEGIAKVLVKLTDSLSDKELLKLSRGVQDVIQNNKKILKDAQAVTQDVRETAKASETAFQNLANATKDNSPLTVFLANTVKQAASLKKALDSAVGARGAMDELTKKGGLEFLTPETALSLSPLVEEYKQLQTQSDNYNKTLATSEAKLKQLQKELSSGPLSFTAETEKRSELARLPDIIDNAKSKLGDLNGRMEQIAETARKLIQDSVVRQIDASLANFKLRLAQLGVQQQQFIVGTYKEQTQESVKRQTDLAIKAIDIQSKLSDSNMKLVLGIELLRLQVQRDADLRELQFYKEAQDRGNVLEPQIEQRIPELQKRIARTGEVERAIGAFDVTRLSELAKQDPTLVALLDQLKGGALARQGFANQREQAALKGAIDLAGVKTRDIVEGLQSQAEAINRQLNEMTDQGPGGQQARFELNQRLSALRLQIEQERYKGAIEAAGLTFEADKKAAKTPAALEEAQKVFDAAISRSTKLYNEALADIESSSRKTLSELAARGEEAVQQVRLTEVTRLLDNLTATTERTQAADNAALTLLEQKLDYERQIFDFKNSTGQLTTEEYRLGTLRLQQLTNELTLQKSLLNAVNARDNATLQLLRDMAAAPGADTEFGPVPQAGQPTFIARGIAMGQAFTDTATAASTLYNQQSSILALNVSLTDSAVKLGETWSQQFSKMTDALMEFVKTGKFSFKDFMTSMLGDFTRTLLQMQMQNFAKALFGGTGAVGSSLAAFFGIPSAMGNAFSTAGVMKYAMGGTFTNQIVNKPTLFKAANGLGVMGEAGPEAIMPLRRGSNGVLGVESSGGAVSVVVNNYGKERAEVKETTDGRGNRKVEVIVGEMVAGEMSRIGSPLQQTMGNTYGLTMPPGRR